MERGSSTFKHSRGQGAGRYHVALRPCADSIYASSVVGKKQSDGLHAQVARESRSCLYLAPVEGIGTQCRHKSAYLLCKPLTRGLRNFCTTNSTRHGTMYRPLEDDRGRIREGTVSSRTYRQLPSCESDACRLGSQNTQFGVWGLSSSTTGSGYRNPLKSWPPRLQGFRPLGL